MASGCSSNNTFNCATITSDQCVKYTGAPVPSLGICTGDRLSELEVVILNKLQDYAHGIGITIDSLDFNQCDFLKSFISCCIQDNSLTSVIQVILKALCQVDSSITTVKNSITTINNSINYTITPGCLTVANTKIDTVLNKLIADYCDFKSAINLIFGGSVTNPVINTTIINQITDSVLNTVLSNIKGCSPQDVVKTGSGINTVLTIRGLTPVGGMIFGKWDSSYFDNTGLGLSTKGMCGWAVCNGNNGTDDWRGFSPAMATNITGPNSLDLIVDPITNLDADYGTNIGDKKGQVKHLLTSQESGLQSHNHILNDPGHKHHLSVLKNKPSNGNNDGTYGSTNFNVLPNVDTDNASTGITINPSTSANAIIKHENRQPTKYVNCIMRIS